MMRFRETHTSFVPESFPLDYSSNKVTSSIIFLFLMNVRMSEDSLEFVVITM